MILDADAPAAVPLVADGYAATIRVAADAADVVDVAASDFADDLERVTGVRPAVADASAASDEEAEDEGTEYDGTEHDGADDDGTEDDGTTDDAVVLVGTAAESELVDACLDRSDVETADFDDGTPFRDCRESFVVATLADPPAALDAGECVLVAGSDRRGTAYGLYELSKRAGVSPWYWWADVPVDERESVAVAEGTYTFGPPSVDHRGIFLNDEDFGLRPWASETHAPEDADDRAGIGSTTYERIFELLLRLKANTVWPAMHPGTKAFYRYPEHAELADRYAIVVGTSHCEPMHRNNVDEWDEDERGAWNYATNADAVRDYWRERVESVCEYENQFTIGMRGIHDSGMPGAETENERVALLQEVIDDQREMLADAHDRPAEDVPQILCPYKEVLPLLRGGLDVPEDVCLVWPDDSHGYMRELPAAAERERAGGSGVYYHLSYWGRPHDFLWLSSVPLALVRHQLRTAYAAGARDCWVANVGDIKPTEKEMEFFLNLAWDVDGPANGPTDQWVEDWARREFGAAFDKPGSGGDSDASGDGTGDAESGSRFLAVDEPDGEAMTADEFAAAVADVLAEYYRLCQARKPEHMGWSTVYPDTEPDEPAYSAVHGGDEARRRLEAFGAIADRASDLWSQLPESYQPAFYQLVVHPVRCAALMTEKYLSAARSRLYAGQGRATADAYAERALGAHDRIGSETEFYNETVLDGKWDGMMSASPRDLPVFDEPSTASVDPHDGAALGVAVEGRRRPVGPHEERPPALPTFDPATDRTGFVDVYARGTGAVEWTAEPGAEWITVSATEGTVSDEGRLSVGVDWEALPVSDTRATGELTVSGAGVKKSVEVRADPTVDGTGADFVETNGHVAMEAESYSERAAAGDRRWEATDLPGRVSGAAMAVRPPVFESVDATFESGEATADAPRLSYDLALESAGEMSVELHCLPTQSVSADHDLRCAVALGDGEPSIVSLDVDGGEHDPGWQRNVLRGAAVGETTDTVGEAGPVRLSVWALDPGVVLDRIVVRTDRDAERATYLGPRETSVDG